MALWSDASALAVVTETLLQIKGVTTAYRLRDTRTRLRAVAASSPGVAVEHAAGEMSRAEEEEEDRRQANLAMRTLNSTGRREKLQREGSVDVDAAAAPSVCLEVEEVVELLRFRRFEEESIARGRM